MNNPTTLLHGRVFTRTGEDASCVVVSGDRIHAVGGDELLERYRDSARVVDVPGLILPGFVDAHTHVWHSAGGGIGAADCRVPGVRSIADVQRVLREHAAKTDGPIVGYGNLFYDRKLEDRRLPNRQDLDEVSLERPVILRCGGHISVLNSVALTQIDSADIAGHTGAAIVFRDADGTPTGSVAEIDAALELPAYDDLVRQEALARALREEYLAHGVTTVGEICESLTGLEAIREVVESGRVDIAVRGYLLVSPDTSIDEAAAVCRKHADPAAEFSLDGIKIFADGGYSARNAAVSTPYLDTTPEHAHGHLALDREQLGTLLTRIRDEGLAAAVHVNGDVAQQLLLEAVPARARVRAEHAGNLVTRWDTISGLIKKNVFLVINPGFLHSYIGDEFPRLFGPGVRSGRMPVRSLLQRGARIAAGADAGLGGERDQSRPLSTVWNLVARPTWSGGIAEAAEAIDVDAALRIVTSASAEALGIGDQVGTIEAGKFADLVVLDRDPRQVPVDEIPAIGVTRVIRRGRLVHGEDW